MVRIAGSAWGYTEKRRERVRATGAGLASPEPGLVDELASTHPHAFALFGLRRRWHGPDRDRFLLANGNETRSDGPSGRSRLPRGVLRRRAYFLIAASRRGGGDRTTDVSMPDIKASAKMLTKS